MERVQRKRVKGYKLPENTKCVNRGTKWGNPYKVVSIGQQWIVKDNEGNHFSEPFTDKSDAAQIAVKYYSKYIEDLIESGERDINELRGKNLACFCSLLSPCHADYLLELINQ